MTAWLSHKYAPCIQNTRLILCCYSSTSKRINYCCSLKYRRKSFFPSSVHMHTVSSLSWKTQNLLHISSVSAPALHSHPLRRTTTLVLKCKMRPQGTFSLPYITSSMISATFIDCHLWLHAGDKGHYRSKVHLCQASTYQTLQEPSHQTL